ncbi:MAG: hypothetical protein QG625_3156 [Cyanobacteriota bacterium erpe_2018_sw_39hr_WHONDRS-SW48-000098_B_bin.30]|jgi:hypothetical protein|nr:hypothetical protein [Cyanobacteriota bacterium erpe_2018_sw_39hr_WHONDRS-SW48-000098_B_bin.30]
MAPVVATLLSHLANLVDLLANIKRPLSLMFELFCVVRRHLLHLR